MSIDKMKGSETIWKMIFQAASDCIFVKDLNLRYVEVNQATATLFGLSCDAVAGRTDAELFGAKAASEISRVDRRILTGETIQEETTKPVGGRMHTFDVVKFPLHCDAGAIIGLCGIARDITEERKATRNLRKVTFGLENAIEGILFLRMDGVICFANRAAADYLGYEKSDLIGMSVEKFDPNVSTDWWVRHLARMKAQKTTQFESVHIRSDGTVYPCEIRSRLIVFEDEELVYATFVDITERRKAEKQLGELSKLLAHYNRVSSLGELASAIAHELNQPLAVITNNSFALSEMINGQDLQSKEISGLAADVSEQAVVAGEIVHRMRGFVSNHETIREIRTVEECIADTLKLLSPHIRRAGIDVHIDELCDYSTPIEIDPIQIQQVLVNVVCNAIEAMDLPNSSCRELHISSRVSLPFVRICLRDTGGGAVVPVEKMFQPFESTKSNGMGMGLPISRSIIERHGGRMDVESTSSGCMFVITIPAHVEDAVLQANSEAMNA